MLVCLCVFYKILAILYTYFSYTQIEKYTWSRFLVVDKFISGGYVENKLNGCSYIDYLLNPSSVRPTSLKYAERNSLKNDNRRFCDYQTEKLRLAKTVRNCPKTVRKLSENCPKVSESVRKCPKVSKTVEKQQS